MLPSTYHATHFPSRRLPLAPSATSRGFRHKHTNRPVSSFNRTQSKATTLRSSAVTLVSDRFEQNTSRALPGAFVGSTAFTVRNGTSALNYSRPRRSPHNPTRVKRTFRLNAIASELPIRRRFLRRLARRNRTFRPHTVRSKAPFAATVVTTFSSVTSLTARTTSRPVRKAKVISRLHRLPRGDRGVSLNAAALNATSGSEGSTRGSVTYATSTAAGTSSPIRLTALLSLITGRPVHLTRLPALALARYALDRNTRAQTSESARTSSERRASSRGLLRSPQSALASLASFTDKASTGSGGRRSSGATSSGATSAALLGQLAQERGGRFQYAAVLLPDLLRLTFLAVYLKKAAFLADLLAFALGQLPRNRKETQFLRILRKVVKVLVAARPERLGVRIRVVGRVNRWRRTKALVGEKGTLPLYTYRSRLEAGQAQAITRKGALGLRVWLAYHPGFARSFRRTLLSFVSASSQRRLSLLLAVKQTSFTLNTQRTNATTSFSSFPQA